MDNAERSRIISKYHMRQGCVMRALESGFGVRATDDERASWLRFQVFWRSLYKGTADPKLAALYEPLLPYPNVIQERLVDVLVRMLTTNDTPMGDSLRKYNYEFSKRTTAELLRFTLRRGTIVTTAYVTPSEGHMAHLTASGSRLVMASDYHNPLPHFPVDKKLASYIFSPK